MSYGIKPFPELQNKDVIDVIERGERLARPSTCPLGVYSLMSSCWTYRPSDRPNFPFIKARLRSVAHRSTCILESYTQVEHFGDRELQFVSITFTDVTRERQCVQCTIKRYVRCVHVRVHLRVCTEICWTMKVTNWRLRHCPDIEHFPAVCNVNIISPCVSIYSFVNDRSRSGSFGLPSRILFRTDLL